MSLNGAAPRSWFLLALALCVSICGGSVYWLSPSAGYAADAPVDVVLSSTPAPEHIRPDGEAATVTLTALSQGKPLEGGRLTLQMLAPPRSTVLTTDFPHVEGSTLLALTTDLQHDGTFTLQYVFPIRGVYTLALQIAPLPEGPMFRPTSLTKTIAIAENPAEVRNAWFLVLGLFGLGLIVGCVLARSAAARDAAQSSVLAMPYLLLGGLLVLANTVMAAPEHAHLPRVSQGAQAVQGPEGWELAVQPQPAAATVGQLVDLAITLKKDGQVWPHSLDVLLTASNQEDGKEIFRTTLRTQAGQLVPRLQLFDGAPHSITVTVHPAEGVGPEAASLTVTMGLEVIGLHPPMAVKLRLMALFVILLTGGMAAGFFWPRRFKEPMGV